MNVELKKSIEKFVARFTEPDEQGTVATKEEIEEVNRSLGGILPPWYVELVTTYPICGLSFQWQAFPAEDDFDGRSWIMWSRPQDIIQESTQLYPGINLLKIGYFNVACDEDGCGDPYFINSKDGDNPSIYQVYHECVSGADTAVGEFDAAIAGHSLSQFFDKAIVEND